MKILFTNSPLHFTHGHVFLQPDWPTLILPTLAGIVRQGHNVRLVDNMRLRFRSNRIFEETAEFKPDIIGFSIIAAVDILKSIDVIKKVRQAHSKAVIIAGGQGSDYYYEMLFKNGVDFVVHGEAESVLPELVSAIRDNTRDFSSIRSISYSVGNRVQRTEELPFIKDLDTTPFPAVDLMPNQKSRWFRGRFAGAIEMSRGCPFDCNFCAITHYWKRSFRQKSNQRIIEELKVLKRYNRTHIYLTDDNFAMDAKKHMELFEMILKENLDIKFFAQIRADTIVNNPEMIKLAARAGMYGGLVGFDTYEPGVFNNLAKIGSAELNIRASTILRKNRIAVFGSHVYAFPSHKSPADFKRSFWMGRKYSDCFRMSMFTPHPGTKFHQELMKKQLIDPEEGNALHVLLVGDKEYRRKMTRGYYLYQLIHALSPSEILGAFFHPDKVVRKFKFYAYVMAFRFVLYGVLRKLRLCDI